MLGGGGVSPGPAPTTPAAGRAGGELPCCLLKKRLPEGRSLVSSLSANAPSLAAAAGGGGVLGGSEEEGEEAGEEAGSESGGEWSLRKLRPYFSL